MITTNARKAAFASLLSLALIALMVSSGANRAHADDIPVVEITAKRFAFTPDKITLKKGQTVKLRLHSETSPTASSCARSSSTKKFPRARPLKLP